MGAVKPEQGSAQREYDWDEVEPTVAIIESIAELEHGDRTDTEAVLEAPLYSYTDPDALETLVRTTDVVSVSLRIDDYRVRIHGNTVTVSAVEPTATDSP